VINPIVLLSTAFAFQGDWKIVALRMVMTFSVAVSVGLLVSTLFRRPPPGGRRIADFMTQRFPARSA